MRMLMPLYVLVGFICGFGNVCHAPLFFCENQGEVLFRTVAELMAGAASAAAVGTAISKVGHCF